MKKYIKILRNNFKKYNIDGDVIPKNDEYFTEYSRVNRLKIISNFIFKANKESFNVKGIKLVKRPWERVKL